MKRLRDLWRVFIPRRSQYSRYVGWRLRLIYWLREQ